MIDLLFSDTFEQQRIVVWRNDLRRDLDAGGLDSGRIRRILAIFVELSQNIQRYAAGTGTVRVIESKSRMTLVARNRVEPEAVARFRAALKQASSLSRNDIAGQIHKKRCGSRTQKGAGLGLLQIARMSDIGLQWEMEDDTASVTVKAAVDKGVCVEDLIIQRGNDTLGITCSAGAGRVELSGVSFPEDAFAFFTPVHDWISGYLEGNSTNLELICSIEYLNSSSSKCLFDLFDMIAAKSREETTVSVVWRYAAGDDDARDVGAEFAEDVDVPFSFEPMHEEP